VNQPSSVAAVILAAGASSRMGSPKALLTLDGETFLDRMIRLFEGCASPVVVVLGHHADQIRAGIRNAGQARFIVNPDPERGMLSSLQNGLSAAAAEVDAVMFTPVDHPGILPATVDALIRRFESERAPATIPQWRGKHGHPVLIARNVASEILALPFIAQASDVIHRYRGATAYVDVDDPAVTADIDDPSAYAELTRQRRGKA